MKYQKYNYNFLIFCKLLIFNVKLQNIASAPEGLETLLYKIDIMCNLRLLALRYDLETFLLFIVKDASTRKLFNEPYNY